MTEFQDEQVKAMSKKELLDRMMSIQEKVRELEEEYQMLSKAKDSRSSRSVTIESSGRV